MRVVRAPLRRHLALSKKKRRYEEPPDVPLINSITNHLRGLEPHTSHPRAKTRDSHALFARFGWIFKRAERSCDRSLRDVVTVVAALVVSRDGAQTSDMRSFMLMMSSSGVALNTAASDKLR